MKQFWKPSIYWRLIAAVVLFSILSSCASQPPAGSESNTPQEKSAPSADLSFSENSTIFEINPAESEARFMINEILRGEEKTVVGQTTAVKGQIAVDFEDPPSSFAGPIQVNALTLETDNAFRNRALHTRILLATIYEQVTFTPTAVRGVPESITFGEPVEFQIEGDLTITAYTEPATFEVTVIPISKTRLEGQARTVINRSDFDLVIPSAPGVAGVEETVTLELDFVASAVVEQ